jgi:hypothetical protein
VLVVDLAALASGLASVLGACWSDRIGRRRVLLGACLALVSWSLVMFPLIGTGSPVAFGIGLSVLLGLVGLAYGPRRISARDLPNPPPQHGHWLGLQPWRRRRCSERWGRKVGLMSQQILTEVSAQVPEDRADEVLAAYDGLLSRPLPEGLVRTELLRRRNGEWRIHSLWRDQTALDAMRASGEPPAAPALFRQLGAQPMLHVYRLERRAVRSSDSADRTL